MTERENTGAKGNESNEKMSSLGREISFLEFASKKYEMHKLIAHFSSENVTGRYGKSLHRKQFLDFLQ